MRDVVLSSKFKRDFKHLRPQQKAKLENLVDRLRYEFDLPPNARPHAMVGTYAGCVDCHVTPDLVLIYRIVGDTVNLYRIGSHSNLGLA